uniref:Uncharacterized protein n=1 Tax=Arundo donax TaxID=35708 RepID=A0A0A9G6H6_ARUDO
MLELSYEEENRLGPEWKTELARSPCAPWCCSHLPSSRCSCFAGWTMSEPSSLSTIRYSPFPKICSWINELRGTIFTQCKCGVVSADVQKFQVRFIDPFLWCSEKF